jgi:hypothetical protein
MRVRKSRPARETSKCVEEYTASSKSGMGCEPQVTPDVPDGKLEKQSRSRAGFPNQVSVKWYSI